MESAYIMSRKDRSALPDKIKVRIAVAIGSEGNWSAVGYGGKDGFDPRDTGAARTAASDFCDTNGPVQFRWIEAEVDAPAEPVSTGIQL